MFDAQGQANFARENIDGAEGQDAEPRPRKTVRCVGEAVENLVLRAIAAGGHNQFKTVRHRFPRQPAGVTGRDRGLQRAARGDFVQVTSEMPGLVATRRRIENDASPHALNDLGVPAVSRGESEAFACAEGGISRSWET